MVGLLYGVMLPMFPRRPILLGGVIAPLLWTGLLHATLQMVNPTLDGLIDWPWFAASQIGFGVVAGVVVTRTALVRTLQFESFAVRAGVRARAPRTTASRGMSGEARLASAMRAARGRRPASAATRLPGRPKPDAARGPARRGEGFALLYAENCAGCHGPEGKGNAGAIGLANPVYLAIADDARPAARHRERRRRHADARLCAQRRAARSTDEQVEVLVQGIRGWAQPDALAGASPPPYAATSGGDAGARRRGLRRRSARPATGPKGAGGPKAGSIVDGSFLGLVSDQSLRTTVIAGRPDIGQPDWRSDVPGRALDGAGGLRRRGLARLAAPGDPGPAVREPLTGRSP